MDRTSRTGPSTTPWAPGMPMIVVASPSGASFWPRMPSMRNPIDDIRRASGGGSASTGGGGGGGGPRWRGAPASVRADAVDDPLVQLLGRGCVGSRGQRLELVDAGLEHVLGRLHPALLLEAAAELEQLRAAGARSPRSRCRGPARRGGGTRAGLRSAGRRTRLGAPRARRHGARRRWHPSAAGIRRRRRRVRSADDRRDLPAARRWWGS